MLIPLAIGFSVVAVLELIALLTFNLVAGNHQWASFDVRVGPILLFAHERTESTTELTLGAGLLLLALAGGALNAGGAAVLQRRV